MTTRASGYVADIEYPPTFYRELSPSYLAYLCATQGFNPPPLGEGASYCELGCGQGLGTAIVAASNSRMSVWGLDFNPNHIANAKRLASDGGLRNASFLNHSFEQALHQPAGSFPAFDYIVMHGVYSWVSLDNRRFILEFIDRYLKPGGIVYVSYNCLPGWSGLAPLQRLFCEYASRHPGATHVQMKEGFEFVKGLASAKAQYLTQNPSVSAQLNEMASANPSYLAHEYLSEHWAAMYHADVARDLAAVQLEFVGSASLIENNDRMSMPAAIAQQVRDTRDSVWRETLRDFARNQKFRRDIFTRGGSRMKPPEQSDAISNVKLALLTARHLATYTFQAEGGTFRGSPELYVPLLDALAERPHTVKELIRLPRLEGRSATSVMDAINLLIHFAQIHPLLQCAEAAGEGRERLNRAIARRIQAGEVLGHIAVPAAGTGMPADYVDLIAILALAEGIKPNPKEVAEFGWSVMRRTGRRMRKNKVSLQSQEENVAALQAQLEHLCATQLPVWKGLGIIENT